MRERGRDDREGEREGGRERVDREGGRLKVREGDGIKVSVGVWVRGWKRQVRTSEL